MGRTRVDVNELKSKYEENLQVLRTFYCTYWRSPSADEFIACGGDIKLAKQEVQGTFPEYLQFHGYEPWSRKVTVGVFNQDDLIEFMGTIKDVEDVYGLTEYRTSVLIKNGKTFDDGLTLKIIPFIGIDEFYKTYKFAN